MAVPKKRSSKSKSKIRKAIWKQKASVASENAVSLAKSVLVGRESSFVYINSKING